MAHTDRRDQLKAPMRFSILEGSAATLWLWYPDSPYFGLRLCVPFPAVPLSGVEPPQPCNCEQPLILNLSFFLAASGQAEGIGRAQAREI